MVYEWYNNVSLKDITKLNCLHVHNIHVGPKKKDKEKGQLKTKEEKNNEIKLQWKTKKQEKNHKSITMVLHVCMKEKKIKQNNIVFFI